MSRTTSFGPSVSIRPSNLARAVKVNTPAPAATPKTSTQRPPFTSYRGGNISPVTGCPAGQISIAGTCVAIPTYSTPASNSPAAAMQTIRDKICADRPNDPICKLTIQTPTETIAKIRSKVKNIVKPVINSIPTLPVTKPTPVVKHATDHIQEIRDKICAENPEACKPYPINERGLPIAAKKLQRKYCEDHPDSELCKIGDRPVKTLPVTKLTPVVKHATDHIQEIRDKICNDSPELCEFVKQTPTPTPFANREEILKRTAEARKYCVEHPDTPVCKIIFNHPVSPASEQPNNEPGTPANTNPPANVPDSSASG